MIAGADQENRLNSWLILENANEWQVFRVILVKSQKRFKESSKNFFFETSINLK